MGAIGSKLKCLFLPAQSGKTRKMEDLIKYYKEIHEYFGDGDVNIIISANNRLLVEQTKVRMQKDLATPSEERQRRRDQGGRLHLPRGYATECVKNK